MLDRVTHRTAMRDELITIIRMLLKKSPAIKGDLPKPSAEETTAGMDQAK
jgi:acetyl-CoA carboxylase carboxyl transferase subunit beta